MKEIHVMPVGDLREHAGKRDCWCQPIFDGINEEIVIHNSLDGREDFEEGRRLAS